MALACSVRAIDTNSDKWFEDSLEEEWQIILPKKYEIRKYGGDRYFWSHISQLYEGTRGSVSGVNAVIEYVKNWEGESCE